MRRYSLPSRLLRVLLLALVAGAYAAIGTNASAQIAFRASSQAGVAATGIDLRGVGTVASAGNGNVTPGLPAGTAAGDLLIAVVETKDNVALSMAGWSTLFT